MAYSRVLGGFGGGFGGEGGANCARAIETDILNEETPAVRRFRCYVTLQPHYLLPLLPTAAAVITQPKDPRHRNSLGRSLVDDDSEYKAWPLLSATQPNPDS